MRHVWGNFEVNQTQVFKVTNNVKYFSKHYIFLKLLAADVHPYWEPFWGREQRTPINFSSQESRPFNLFGEKSDVVAKPHARHVFKVCGLKTLTNAMCATLYKNNNKSSQLKVATPFVNLNCLFCTDLLTLIISWYRRPKLQWHPMRISNF